MNKIKFWEKQLIKARANKFLQRVWYVFIWGVDQVKNIFHKETNFYFSRSSRGRILFVCVMIGLILILGIGLSLLHHRASASSKHTISRSKISSTALRMQTAAQKEAEAKALQTTLQKIQQEISNVSLSQEKGTILALQITALKKDIQMLKDGIVTAKNVALANNAQAQANEASENKRTEQMTKQLSKISKAIVPKKYLSLSALPFQVVGIDFWNGKPMVSIAMKDINGVMHYRLIGVGMKFDCGVQSSKVKVCSNWTLHELQTSPNEAVFINDRDQKVKMEF